MTRQDERKIQQLVKKLSKTNPNSKIYTKYISPSEASYDKTVEADKLFNEMKRREF